MRSSDPVKKKEGARILENYRKQTSEFVKRVKQEGEESKSESSSSKSSGSANRERKFLEQRIKIIESPYVPDPKDINAIIKKVKTLHP